MPSRINLPYVTRILLPTLLFQSLVGLAIRYRHATQPTDIIIAWLVFLPSHSLHYPWTLLTATLVESNLVTLALATLTIFYGGRYLERAWTSAEFVKFLLVISLVPNLLCYGTLSFLSALTGNTHWMDIIIHGTLPLQISFLVAFSQLVPTHTVTIFKGIISVRVTRLPLLHLTSVSFLALTPILSAASLLLVLFGFMVSWTYLRFYKQNFPDLQTSQTSLRGDASETFAFTEFFPDPVKPVIATVSNKIFEILVTLRICTPVSVADISASRGELFMHRGTPGSARAEAERRRALALKALDQRLHAATAAAHSKTSNSSQATSAGPSTQIQSQINEPESVGLRNEITFDPEIRPEEGRFTG